MKKILILGVSVFALSACTPDEDTVFPQSVPGKTVFARSLDDAQKSRKSLLQKYDAELSYEFGKSGDTKDVKDNEMSKTSKTDSNSAAAKTKTVQSNTTQSNNTTKSSAQINNEKETVSINKKSTDNKSIQEDKIWKNAVQYLARYPLENISDSSKLISTEWFDVNNASKKINVVVRGDSVEVSVFVRNKNADGTWSKTFKNQKDEEKIKNIILGKQSK